MKKRDKQNMENGFVLNFAQEIENVSNARYRAIVTHTMLELLSEVLVECKCKHGADICEQMQYTHAIKLVILNEANIISDFEFRMLDAMRKVRNKAAHAGKFQLTPNLVKPFDEMNRKDPPMDFTEPNNFFNLCVELVFMFWNTHCDVFSKYFHPNPSHKKTA